MRTTTDLAGGLESQADELVATPVGDDPEWREAVNVWFADGDGRFGLSRAMVERVARDWENPMVKPLNLAFADGRALSGTGEGGSFSGKVSARVTSSKVAGGPSRSGASRSTQPPRTRRLERSMRARVTVEAAAA